MNIWNRPDRIPQIYGTFIALGLIIYLMLMYAVGLVHVIELRLLNIFIMMAGIYLALKQYRRTHQGHLNYFRALVTGTVTATIGTSTFAVFLFAFLKLEKNLMQSIQQNEPLGIYLNPYIASYIIMLEGVFSGFGITYLLINFFQTDRATDPVL